MGLVISLALIGCKGNGRNNPDDPAEKEEYTYNAATRKYEVTLKNGQKLYFEVAALEVREGKVIKLDTALTLINYPKYKRGDDKSYKDEQNYLYKGNVSIPATITLDKKWTVHSMMNYAFYYCPELCAVDLPKTIEQITYMAFAGSENLTSASFHATEVSDYAFYDCKSLQSIKCYSVIPPQIISDCTFGNVPKFKLYVPQESIEAYKQSDWVKYAKDILSIE